MATNFLGLDLPVVSVTIGPTWATKVNAAFDVIDLHDHSSGKGVQIPVSGLSIDDNLNFGSYKPYNLLSTQYISNSATLTGATNINSTYVKSGNLYFTNSAGTAVQITSGGTVVTSPSSLQTVETQAVSSDVTISPAATYVYIKVDTTAARQITLPLASSVADGRIYIIKDISGSANTYPITLVRQGSDLIDGSSSYIYNSNYGSIWIVGDSVSNWYIS